MQHKNIDYDIIIIGGGGAGLSLAHHISREKKLSNLSVLLIDREKKDKNDRTWCFWATEPPPLVDEVVSSKWEQLGFASPDFSHDFTMQPYNYYQVRGIDFYQKTTQEINQAKNISTLFAEVEAVQESGNSVSVNVGDTWLKANYVFDSRFDETWLQQISQERILLLQHFKGWVIETPTPTFNEQKAQFFDFNIPQKDEVRFVYILPQSDKKALIEFTIFSQSLLSDEAYDLALQDYLNQFYPNIDYAITEVETGIIPMSDAVFQQSIGKRIMNIGTRGGMCKASSGFAFLNMQRDSQQIVKNLVKGNHPNKGRKRHWRFWWYDAIMLRVMQKKGGRIAAIFAELFRKNPIQRTLRFLDERTSFAEDVKIMWSVPTWFFIKMFFGVLYREFILIVKRPTKP